MPHRLSFPMPRDLSSDDVASYFGESGSCSGGMGKSIPKGTLASILRQAGITRKEAERLLGGERAEG